mgnify:CR=1 FL=1
MVIGGEQRIDRRAPLAFLGASTEPPMVIGGEPEHDERDPVAARGFNGAADGDRRRAALMAATTASW